MLIGVDLDEVVFDFVTSFLIYHNSRNGTSLSRDEISKYRVIGELCGNTKKEVDETFKEFYNTELFKNVQPMEGSNEGIRLLSKNHQLHAITSRPGYLHDKTKESLNKHFPNSFLGLHFSMKKIKKKSEICKDLGINLLIEDSLEYAKECASEGVKVLLLDSPWNQSEKLPEGITRVYSWKDIVNKV